MRSILLIRSAPRFRCDVCGSSFTPRTRFERFCRVCRDDCQPFPVFGLPVPA